MNKKLLKKALAAVLTAALLFTSNGVATNNASAAEKIRVENVYTNFLKATMVTGATKQITTDVEPENATYQKMRFNSSNVKVATVSATGLVTAVSPGTTKITVSALDGSSNNETVKITVLKDLVITKKNVDSDNEVIVLDKTYGHVTISESVGDADIYLAGVTIKGSFTLEEGDYTVSMYESTAKEVVIDKAAATDEIVSLAVTEEDTKTPTLFVGEDTKIAEINAKISAMIKQGDGSQIDGLTFTQDSDGKIKLFLDNYNGTLSIDASFGDIEIVATGCNLADVVVTGGANTGAVQLTNAGESTIGNLTLMGAANVDLAMPTTLVQIDSTAKGTSLTTKESVGTITSAGTDSKITVTGTVDNFTSTGINAAIDIKKGGSVPTITISGDGSSLKGEGEVSEAAINADNCVINTPNTLITIGDVDGTKVQGKEVSGNSTATTDNGPAAGGGGGGAGAPVGEKEIAAGDIIVSNDFEDNKNGLVVTMDSYPAGVTMSVAEGGNVSAKALWVRNRTANYHGVGYNFTAYLKKNVTVRVKFDIKCSADGNLRATMKYNSSKYATIAEATATTAGTWYTLEGTFALDNTILDAVMYIETEGTSSYYIDNVKITVDFVGDPVPVTGVSLDKETIDLDIGVSSLLKATVDPITANNPNVTWMSSNANVATITDGTVKAIGAGTTTITVKTVDGGFTDTCIVNVSANIALALDYGTVLLESIGATKEVKANVNTGIVWASLDPTIATVTNGVITSVANGTTTVTATLGVNSVSCNVVVTDKVVYYEDFEGTNTLTNESWAIKNTLLSDEKEAYNGTGYLQVVNNYQYNGHNITLDNTSGTTEATFVITAYIKTAVAGNGVEFFHDNSALGYTITKAVGSPTEWTKLQSSELKVAAGSSIKVRIISSEKEITYFLDSVYITKTMAAADLSDHAITGVTLNKSTLSLATDATETLIATIAPANASTSKTITWSSSNSTVASVDSTGKVTAGAVTGSAIITAKTTKDATVSTTEFTASCTVTVTEALVVPITILSNGFEDGVTYGLKGTVGTGLAFVSGGANANSTKSMQITTADVGWGNPGYDLLAYKGKTVTIIAYLKQDEGGDRKLSASLQQTAGGTTTYPQTGIITSTGVWTKFVLEVAIPATTTVANFYFEKAYGETGSLVNYNLDNVLIYEGTTAQAQAKHDELFPSVIIPVETIVLQSGFEETELKNNSSTTFSIGTVDARTGSHSLFVNGANADYKGPEFTLTADGTYTVSTYVKSASGSQPLAFMNASTYDEYSSRQTNDGSGWTQLQATVSVSGSAVTLRICPKAASSSSAVSYYIDDFVVTKDASSFVIKSSFEEIILINNSSTTFSIVTNDMRTGSQSLFVNAANADYKGPEFTISESGTYTVTAYVKSASGSQDFAFMNTSTYGEYSSRQTNDGSQWTKIEGTVTVESGTPVTLRIAPKTASSSNTVSYYIDDFKVVR
ncbi:MAG: carbohydrate binding domain-containing protein [Mobilitalea sp.]